MSKILNIIEGWRRVGLPTKESEVLYATRYKHCENCPSNVKQDFIERHPITAKIMTFFGEVCSECSCPLQAKLRSKNESCPIGKWNAKA